MKNIVIAVASALLSTAASANSSGIIVQGAPMVRVSYADLNIRSSAGQAMLAGRIRSVADTLCTERNVAPLKVRLQQIKCYSTAIASGAAQLDAITDR